MWTVIGVVLIVYAIVAIIILLGLRKDLVKLWDRQVIKIQQLIDRGRGLLVPVAGAAAATRSGGGHVTAAADHIEQTVPPAIESAANSLDGVATALQGVPQNVADFVRDASAGLNGSLDAIADAIQHLTTDTIPATSETLRGLSEDLDSPGTDDGITSTLEAARQVLIHIGGDSLPAAADGIVEAKKPVTALLVLTDIVAGPFVPLALAVRSTADILLGLLGDLGGQLKIGAGQLGQVVVPPTNINFPGLTIPKGVLLHFDQGLPGPLPDIKFDVPDHDHLVGDIHVNAGDWVNLKLPPSPIELYNGAGLVAGIKEMRKGADALIEVVTGAKFDDIRDKLQAAADKLKVTAAKLKDLAENPKRLPRQVERLQERAKSLLVQADKLDSAATKLSETATKLQAQVAKILTALQTLSSQVDSAVAAALTQLQGLAGDLRNFSLVNVLNDLRRVGGDLTTLADTIDDGRPTGAPGKTDLAQRLADVFDAVDGAIPPRDQVLRITNGVFGFLVAVHIVFFVVGIALVWKGGLT